MCGLYGWVAKTKKTTVEDRKLLTLALAWKTEPRGTDSYGMLTCAEDGRHSIARGLGTFKSKPKNCVRASTLALMGHNRLGTHGETTIANAHPFVAGEWVMAHNGVMNDADYKKEALILPGGDTDSEAFLCYLASQGIVDSELFLREIFLNETAGQAYTFYNSREGIIYLVSTTGRTLHIAESADFIVYASEAVIARTSLKIVQPKAEILESVIVDCSIYSLDIFTAKLAKVHSEKHVAPEVYKSNWQQSKFLEVGI